MAPNRGVHGAGKPVFKPVSGAPLVAPSGRQRADWVPAPTACPGQVSRLVAEAGGGPRPASTCCRANDRCGRRWVTGFDSAGFDFDRPSSRTSEPSPCLLRCPLRTMRRRLFWSRCRIVCGSDRCASARASGWRVLRRLGAVSCGVCGLGEALHEGEEGWCLADEQSGVCEEGEGAHGRTGCFGGADDRADRELAVEEDLWVRA